MLIMKLKKKKKIEICQGRQGPGKKGAKGREDLRVLDRVAMATPSFPSVCSESLPVLCWWGSTSDGVQIAHVVNLEMRTCE